MPAPVNLVAWVEQLTADPASGDMLALHCDDTLAAFLAGLETEEGGALARLYARQENPAALAACAAAIARLSECDDIHLPSCVTPGAIAIPSALSLAEPGNALRFPHAVTASYRAGLALGSAIGGALALGKGVWPTLFAAPAMAALAASVMQELTAEATAHALALALGGAGGRLGRPSGSPSGRWYLLAEAVMRGLHAAEAAKAGFRGDPAILTEPWLEAAAGHAQIAMEYFSSSSGIESAGFKPFPVARQGLNAVEAFRHLLREGLDPARIESLEVFVPQQNAMLLSRPIEAEERLSLIANAGLQLAFAAFAPDALYEADRKDELAPHLLEFAARVKIVGTDEFDALLPGRWPARLAAKSGGRL